VVKIGAFLINGVSFRVDIWEGTLPYAGRLRKADLSDQTDRFSGQDSLLASFRGGKMVFTVLQNFIKH
jgi:hypothetical protein